jgi:hypothetical protein
MTGVWSILALVLAAAPLPPVAKPDKAAIEAQIARLKSPNKDPNPELRGRGEYPDGYDFKAQEAVVDAKRQLTKMGKDAFPTLIAHGEDKGYCLSTRVADLVGHSIGTVCLDIIEEQVDTAGMRYKAREGADGKKLHIHRGYFDKYYGDNTSRCAAFKKWYDEHETKTLKEMQIEALEWAIEREKAIGFPGKKDQESYLTPLERKLDELKKK